MGTHSLNFPLQNLYLTSHSYSHLSSSFSYSHIRGKGSPPAATFLLMSCESHLQSPSVELCTIDYLISLPTTVSSNLFHSNNSFPQIFFSTGFKCAQVFYSFTHTILLSYSPSQPSFVKLSSFVFSFPIHFLPFRNCIKIFQICIYFSSYSNLTPILLESLFAEAPRDLRVANANSHVQSVSYLTSQHSTPVSCLLPC